MGIAQEPLFQVFLNVQKTYYSQDIERCLEFLRGYGLGPNLARILDNYWYRQQITHKVGKFMGGSVWNTDRSDAGRPQIPNYFQHRGGCGGAGGTCGSMQPAGGTAWHGMGGGEINLFFFMDDRSIAGWDHEWV